MVRQFARLAAAGLVTIALGAGLATAPAAVAAPTAGTPARAAATCDEAKAAYAEAKATQSKFFIQHQKLVKARKQLHRAHAHGTAAEFQQAKNRVRQIKAKIFKFKKAMNRRWRRRQPSASG